MDKKTTVSMSPEVAASLFLKNVLHRPLDHDHEAVVCAEDVAALVELLRQVEAPLQAALTAEHETNLRMANLLIQRDATESRLRGEIGELANSNAALKAGVRCLRACMAESVGDDCPENGTSLDVAEWQARIGRWDDALVETADLAPVTFAEAITTIFSEEP